MTLLYGPPLILLREEHVLHAVGGIEDAGHHAAARAVERAEEHGLALFVGEVRLLEEGVAIDGVLVQRPGVLRHPQRGIGAEQFGQVGGVVRRVRDRQRGIFGIDVDRRRVERKLGLGLGEQKARDAA